MIKQSSVYILAFTLSLLLAFYIHQLILSEFGIQLPFSLNKAYLFHGGFSLLVCVNLLFLSRMEKFKDQIGFFYLLSVAVKIVFLFIVFNKEIFSDDSFTQQESINLLIPMFLALILEVFFISKLLKNANPLKNTK